MEEAKDESKSGITLDKTIEDKTLEDNSSEDSKADTEIDNTKE